jgi:hypothetical protein
MTLHYHFHSFLDEVHREGRYRVFTDLERHVHPMPLGAAAALPATSLFGARTIISEWGATPPSSTQ